MADIDEMQFAFVPGDTTDAIFIVPQLQEKYLPMKNLWQKPHHIEEWVVCIVQGMYSNARSRVRVGSSYKVQ